jgi:hypothetical protein
MREDEIIEASYRVTLAELLSAHSMAVKVFNSRRPWLLRERPGSRVVMGLMVVMMLLCLAISVVLEIDSPTLYFIVALFLIMTGLVFCMPWILKGVLRRRLKNTPALDKLVRFSVDVDGVNLRTEGLSESSIKWTGYLRVARTPQGFLFFQNEQVYNWLPHHALASDRDAHAVATLASLHATEYLDLT